MVISPLFSGWYFPGSTYPFNARSQTRKCFFYLLWRARNLCIGAENTTVAYLWNQYGMAIGTLVEKLAGLHRHFYLLEKSTLRTLQSGFGYDFHFSSPLVEHYSFFFLTDEG